VFLMTIALKARANKVVTGSQGLIGEIAVSQSSLSPLGKVLVHGELWDAVSSADVAAGESVVVRRVNGLQLQVEPASSPQETPAAAKAW
jgi:membrane-bound serine protease (ClpP class)